MKEKGNKLERKPSGKFKLCSFCTIFYDSISEIYHNVYIAKKGFTFFCPSAHTRIFWANEMAVDLDSVKKEKMPKDAKILL